MPPASAGRVGESSFDWKTLIAAKDAEIARLEGLYQKGLSGANAEILETRAELVDAHTIRLVKTGETVTAKTHRHRRPAAGRTRMRHFRGTSFAFPPTRRSISKTCRKRS